MIFNYTADFSHKDGTQNERKKRGSRKKKFFRANDVHRYDFKVKYFWSENVFLINS